jgi:hypothetical protein
MLATDVIGELGKMVVAYRTTEQSHQALGREDKRGGREDCYQNHSLSTIIPHLQLPSALTRQRFILE